MGLTRTGGTLQGAVWANTDHSGFDILLQAAHHRTKDETHRIFARVGEGEHVAVALETRREQIPSASRLAAREEERNIDHLWTSTGW